MEAQEKKFKRRRYGKDVVIYTVESGQVFTLEASLFADPWKTSNNLLKVMNAETNKTTKLAPAGS